MAAARLDAILGEYSGKVGVRWRAFPLEIINRRPAPRHIVDQEWPLIAVQESRAPCRAWPHEEYLKSTLPAFEAYSSAYEQDPEKARVFDLRVRRAFFYEGRRIDEAVVLRGIAAAAGLDSAALGRDLEAGRYRDSLMADHREAIRLRDEEGLPMTSPTLLLPTGEAFHNPFASEKRIENGKLVEVSPPPCSGEEALNGYRGILDKALR